MEIPLSRHKPTPNQMELLKTLLTAMANRVTIHAMAAQATILSAQSPEQLATAITQLDDDLANASSDWTTVADQTRQWAP
jgi:hypothetical protein